MNHFETIRDLLDVLLASNEVHVLALESAPGLGKSSTVEQALTQLGASFRSIGSYSTPLHLFNTFSTAKRGAVLILYDCAGLFGNDTAMAILKGATWASAGHGGHARCGGAARRPSRPPTSSSSSASSSSSPTTFPEVRIPAQRGGPFRSKVGIDSDVTWGRIPA